MADTLTEAKPIEVVPPQPQPQPQPSTVDDLERRLRVLREAGVHAYKDGPIEIVFVPAAPPMSPSDRLAATFAELEADARKNGGVL